jgi:hypothetical protein
MHQPIKGDFDSILAAIAMGSGKGKKTAQALRTRKQAAQAPSGQKKK